MSTLTKSQHDKPLTLCHSVKPMSIPISMSFHSILFHSISLHLDQFIPSCSIPLHPSQFIPFHSFHQTLVGGYTYFPSFANMQTLAFGSLLIYKFDICLASRIMPWDGLHSLSCNIVQATLRVKVDVSHGDATSTENGIHSPARGATRTWHTAQCR